MEPVITLDSILENIIAELIVATLSFIIAKFKPGLTKHNTSGKDVSKYDPLSISLFFTSIAVGNLILNLSFWNNQQLTIFLVLTTIALGFVVHHIHENQCPSCKKFIKAKKRVDEKEHRQFTRDWKYQPWKIWLYSNGHEWKREKAGPEQVRKENWVTKQTFYECNFCKHAWDSGQLDVNLDEQSRPKPEVIKTDKKYPNEPTF